MAALSVSDAVVVGCISALSGVVIAWLSGHQRRSAAVQDAELRRQEKQEDWNRADKVARELRERDAETARLLVEQNALVAATSKETHDKLEVIRVDVNSNMTAAMQGELDSAILSAALMRELIQLHRDAGREPSAETLATLKATDDKISELRAKIGDRLPPPES